MKKYFILLILLVSFFPKLTWASTAALYVDTGLNSINALEGSIIVPKEFSITNIYDGNSTILFWVDKPKFDDLNKTIRFSGFTPGGFQGNKLILSFSGEFKQSDLKNFSFSEVIALKNDGLGTVVPVKLSLDLNEIEKDITPPENFSAVVSKSPDVFNNSYFISFATQDKGVGIDHYEYATAWIFNPNKSEYKKVESPIVLTNKESTQRIFIKALDKSGNERISTIYGPYYYESTLIGFIIIILIIWVLFFILRKFL